MTQAEIQWWVSQAVIILFGVPAVFMSQSPKDSQKRWASILGLAGQPAWFYFAYASKGWGAFAMCILYTLAWGRGFLHYWIKPWWAALRKATATARRLGYRKQ